MPLIASASERNKVTPLFINQLRIDIKVRFGDNKTTPGGFALKFYASQRYSLSPAKGSKIKITKSSVERVIGRRIKIRNEKNKLASPFRQAILEYNFENGIDENKELVRMGIESDVLKKKKSIKTKKDCVFYGKKNLGVIDDVNEEKLKLYRDEISNKILDYCEGK
jgi:recombination protein RecA